MSQGGYQKEINGHRVILIEYWHPANRFPSMMNYYTLMVIKNGRKTNGFNRWI